MTPLQIAILLTLWARDKENEASFIRAETKNHYLGNSTFKYGQFIFSGKLKKIVLVTADVDLFGNPMLNQKIVGKATRQTMASFLKNRFIEIRKIEKTYSGFTLFFSLTNFGIDQAATYIEKSKKNVNRK